MAVPGSSPGGSTDRRGDYRLFSIFIGYLYVISPVTTNTYFFILALVIEFMVNSFLSFATSNTFRISYFGIGPTEMCLVFIVVNTVIMLFG